VTRAAGDWSDGPFVDPTHVMGVTDPDDAPPCAACDDPDHTLWSFGLMVIALCPTCDGPDPSVWIALDGDRPA
jgi:hypothetical protein